LRALMEKRLAAPEGLPLDDILTSQELTWLDSHVDGPHFKTMLAVVKRRKSRDTGAADGSSGGSGGGGDDGGADWHDTRSSVYPSVAEALDFDRLVPRANDVTDNVQPSEAAAAEVAVPPEGATVGKRRAGSAGSSDSAGRKQRPSAWR
jgi:hypothetical protein